MTSRGSWGGLQTAIRAPESPSCVAFRFELHFLQRQQRTKSWMFFYQRHFSWRRKMFNFKVGFSFQTYFCWEQFIRPRTGFKPETTGFFHHPLKSKRHRFKILRTAAYHLGVRTPGVCIINKMLLSLYFGFLRLQAKVAEIYHGMLRPVLVPREIAAHSQNFKL